MFTEDQVLDAVDGLSQPPVLQVLELERRVANLERALASQRAIGVVIGIVAQRHHCTTEEAWNELRRLSQLTNLKVRDVARILRDAFDDVSAEADAEALGALRRILPDGATWSSADREV